MTSFVKSQGLPEKAVKLAALSFINEQVVKKLKELDISLIEITENDKLPTPVSRHADMLICHLKSKSVYVAKGMKILYTLLQISGFDVFETKYCVSKNYPDDIKLNCLLLNNKLFCNQKALDINIREFCDKRNIDIVDVKQGYTRCSVCVVNNKSAITADRGIAEVLEKNGIDVLLIEEGHIKLPGYNTGFIGGCSAKLSEDKILFTGNIMSHPSGKQIKDFITKRKISIIECDNENLIDIGGIALLSE